MSPLRLGDGVVVIVEYDGGKLTDGVQKEAW